MLSTRRVKHYLFVIVFQRSGCSTIAPNILAQRLGRFLEWQGLLERDADDCMDAGGRATQGAVAENNYLSGGAVDAGPIDQLLGHSITYRIAIGGLFLIVFLRTFS